MSHNLENSVHVILFSQLLEKLKLLEEAMKVLEIERASLFGRLTKSKAEVFFNCDVLRGVSLFDEVAHDVGVTGRGVLSLEG